MAYKGDTVRFEVEFLSYEGSPLEPTDVTLTLYNELETVIEEIVVSEENKVGAGVYFQEYTIPFNFNEEVIVYEFKGVHKEKTVLSRDTLYVEFV